MLSFNEFLKSLFFLLLLFSTSLVFSNENNLSPSEIEYFRFQLVAMERIIGKMEVKIKTLTEEESNYQKHSNELEREAGQLHKEKNRVESILRANEHELEGHKNNLKNLQGNVYQIKEKIRINEIELEQEKRKYAKCKKYTLGLCKIKVLRKHIFRISNNIKNLSLEIKNQENRLSFARNHVLNSNNKIERLSSELREYTSEFEKYRKILLDVESKIKKIKKNLSELRSMSFIRKSELKNFELSLKEFQNIDINTNKKFVINNLRRESSNLDRIIKESAVFLG